MVVIKAFKKYIVAVLILNLLLCILALFILPDEAAIHFNENGIPDSFAPNFIAVLICFGAGLLCAFVCYRLFKSYEYQICASKSLKAIVWSVMIIISNIGSFCCVMILVLN